MSYKNVISELKNTPLKLELAREWLIRTSEDEDCRDRKHKYKAP